MPITTFLDENEINQPTSDAELDELLTEARGLTGRNYQVVSRSSVERRWLRRPLVHSRMSLYIEVGGMAPWQWLASTQDTKTVRAYLLGLLNGYDEARHV